MVLDERAKYAPDLRLGHEPDHRYEQPLQGQVELQPTDFQLERLTRHQLWIDVHGRTKFQSAPQLVGHEQCDFDTCHVSRRRRFQPAPQRLEHVPGDGLLHHVCGCEEFQSAHWQMGHVQGNGYARNV